MVWRTWQTAWHEALYGPDGFYRQSAGPAGHFATSAQGIPGGGRLLARALVALAERSGCSDVVDVGAGRGELLGEIAALAPGLRLTGVDIVERPRELPAGTDWLVAPGGERLPDGLRDLTRALVVAHEWLDVVPCPIVEYADGVWREVEVADDGTERLGSVVEGPDLQWLQRNWPAGCDTGRAEVGRSREAAYNDLRARIGTGLLVVVDYGHLRGRRPVGGTLTGYRDGVQSAPRPDGSTDITAHVAMDTLGSDELVQQRDLLERLGLRPPRPPIELARDDPAAYLTQLAARGTHAELTAPGGLGDFWWAISTITR
ncbi:SAM-dependent methyltransferase [Flexivirga oryzae]|uniref:SAM-dependent MidA family methyltransferase n=1 Tax=Flexivirga oryzae TaxID=1794944 RepID=A0A839N842_9MICO|nr:SAM-dependent MidA family methyltransferase [Flexivirga oryzae]